MLSNVDVKFGTRRLNWRGDVDVEVMPMVKRVELIEKHEFIKTALNKNSYIFVLHVALLKKNRVYFSKALLIVVLQQNKVLPEVLREYPD